MPRQDRQYSVVAETELSADEARSPARKSSLESINLPVDKHIPVKKTINSKSAMSGIDRLKSKFSAEYRRNGNLKERHAWLRDNRTAKCDRCTQKDLRCEPHPDNVCCQTCTKRKVRCSRLAEEKKDRVMRKLDINEDTFQKLLDWFEHQNDSESDDESEDVDIGAAKKAKKAEVRTEATSCPNKSSPAKDSEKPTRISVKKPTMGLKQKQEPAIKPSISSRSGKGGSASNSGKHLSVSATKHSGKTAEAPRSTLKHRESVNNTATVTKPKKATLNHVSSDSTGSEGLKDALNQAIQSASTFSTSRKSNRSDAASSMRSNHISPQHKQVVRFEEQESDEYDEEDLQDTRKDSCREDEGIASIKSEHDEQDVLQSLHETPPTRDSAFIDLHLIKRQLEVGMGTLTPGHPLRKLLQDSTMRIEDLAALELDKMMLEQPTTSNVSKRSRDLQESSADDNPRRKLRKVTKPPSRLGFT